MNYSNFSTVLKDSCEDSTNKTFVEVLTKSIIECASNKKLICIFGNGGSAADSLHFAGELVCTYEDRSRVPIPAISLSSNTSIVTAWANDFSYDSIFSRQLLAFDGLIGIAIGLSTSGSSKNILNALKTANECNAQTFLFTSVKCSTSPADYLFKVCSTKTGEIQQVHEYIYHLICQTIDIELS